MTTIKLTDLATRKEQTEYSNDNKIDVINFFKEKVTVKRQIKDTLYCIWNNREVKLEIN